jgi:hypothetical protein
MAADRRSDAEDLDLSVKFFKAFLHEIRDRPRVLVAGRVGDEAFAE